MLKIHQSQWLFSAYARAFKIDPKVSPEQLNSLRTAVSISLSGPCFRERLGNVYWNKMPLPCAWNILADQLQCILKDACISRKDPLVKSALHNVIIKLRF